MSKIISINSRTYYDPDWNEINVSVVLIAGENDDYAAYIGVGRDYENIARTGDKLSFEEACVNFPIGLEKSKYRL